LPQKEHEARGVYTGHFPHPVLLAALPAAVALQWAASRAPDLVERAYGRRLYPPIARSVAAVTGRIPLSVGEVLVVAAAGALVVWLGALAVRLWRGRGARRRLLLVSAARLGSLGGAGYLVFLLLWGLNYHRPPLAVTAGLGEATAAVSVEELEHLCADLVAAANRTRAAVREDPQGVGRLQGGVRDALARAVPAVAAAASAYAPLSAPFARPKPVLLSTGMSYLGITGIYLPFTAEANVNAIVPASQLPFTGCHELAHQGGIAPEDEANFLAYAACVRHPDADFRYSGALNAALYALGALAGVDAGRATRLAQWSPAVRRDLDALRAWNERYRGPAETAARAVNDAYLKAQGVPEGVRSYGRMVDLLVLERRRATRAPASPGPPTGAAGQPPARSRRSPRAARADRG
jgi:hypothetical protein